MTPGELLAEVDAHKRTSEAAVDRLENTENVPALCPMVLRAQMRATHAIATFLANGFTPAIELAIESAVGRGFAENGIKRKAKPFLVWWQDDAFPLIIRRAPWLLAIVIVAVGGIIIHTPIGDTVNDALARWFAR
jgi:hypothetical protein